MIRKVFFKTMVSAIIIGAAIASCVEVKDLYDPEYAAKLAEYRAKWVEQFGEIDPNEDWGFGSDEEAAGDSTRVVTREIFANENGNEWTNYVDVPIPLTEEQKNIVTTWFKENKEPEGIKLNWSDFFMQQVSSQECTNSIGVLHIGGEPLVLAQSGNLKFEYGGDNIVFVKDANTSSFSFRPTNYPDEVFYDDNYVIVPGNRISESFVGMYFLGIDYEDSNTERDGYYFDWIIKLTPIDYHETKRIICEDLGTIGDFDFNDIVFDVSDGGWRWDALSGATIHEAVITVRAAGGTLPIFVGGVNIKEALGVAEHIMVNTGAVGGMDNVLPAVFRIPWPESNDLRDIEVLVKTNEAICALTAPTGDAPQKLCVPADFVWPSERVNIKTVYENFPNVGWENGTEPTEPENPNGDVSEYGTLIAAKDLVSGQPIPAKYFKNVGESCTLTFVAPLINGQLVVEENYTWIDQLPVNYSVAGFVEITLSGTLLDYAKSGKLIFYNYAKNEQTQEMIIPNLYIKY